MSLPKYRGRYKEYDRDYQINRRKIPEVKKTLEEYRKRPDVRIRHAAASRRWRRNNPKKYIESKLKSYHGKDSPHRFFHALRAWSKLVRIRDDYTCQICGIRDENKNIAHHILYRSFYEDLALNLNNGITLCKNCHKDAHLLDWFGI